jgi:transcriptional regulator with XRE-family HTH domain
MGAVETLQQTVARNVREYRRARGLTLDALATAADVSRRMLILIERGATNPSIATIDRLGQALGVGFPALVGLPSATVEAQVITPAEMPVVWQGTQAESVAQLAVALGPRGGVEMWQWRLAAGETFVANVDPSGTQKLFYVLDGVLTLRFDGADLRVPAGYGARIPADRPHHYENRDADPVRFLCTIVLGDSGLKGR